MTDSPNRSIQTSLTYHYAIHKTGRNSTDKNVYYIWQAIASHWIHFKCDHTYTFRNLTHPEASHMPGLAIVQSASTEVLEGPWVWPQIFNVTCKGLPTDTSDMWNGPILHEFVADLRCTVKNESGRVYAALAIDKGVKFYRFDARAIPDKELVPLHEKGFDVSKQEDLSGVERMLNYVKDNGLQWACEV
ncbi:hypothetical protein AbraIFM66951_010838 [Aspergillus brasiliensis]|uniref:Uncharacterized protein n=1 Tax=Aspergillus brasiliensis TaxID=319629 RepID=A0A9W5YK63_9EURO|nr:hypothetical protein AbraCBS73388_010075 [Aspergillus brasiliensis]GKZ47471.1 hypothetical protein AbraIFM66951_010838 [Aspergillus brasiliensis]